MCINDGIIYALFAQHIISDRDVVNMTMQVILKMGLFAMEYRTWSILKKFMKDKCRLKKNTSNVAGQFRFGMSTSTNNNNYNKQVDEAYAQSMANFSAQTMPLPPPQSMD